MNLQPISGSLSLGGLSPDVFGNISVATGPAIEPGYLLVYVDNRSIGKDVWFDNVQVLHYNTQVLEENHYYPFGLTTSVNAMGATAQPYKYQGIELEKSFGLETYETFYRGLDPQLGRFKQIDPKANLDYGMSPYVSMRNNPVIMVDPLGDIAGDYYTELGRYLGNDGLNDNKAYTADRKVEKIDDKGNITTTYPGAKELPISHSEMQKQASVVYGESSAYQSNEATEELAREMAAIAYVHQNNKKAFAASDGNEQVALFNKTPLSERIGKFQLANWAIINAVGGGYDFSNGANMWDGGEQSLFPETNKAASVKHGKRTFELHMNTMGWSISDIHYEKWKSNVGSGFKAPQYRIAPDNFPQKGYRNKGKARLRSTAVHGKTIFWEVK